MSSSKSRKKYDLEFKKRAVRLSHSSERTLQEVAESLGIHVQLLYRWRQQYTPVGEKTKLAEAQDEASLLRQRIAELEEENYRLHQGWAAPKKLRPSSQNIKSNGHRARPADGTRNPLRQIEVGHNLRRIHISYYTWLRERESRVERKDQLRPDVLRIFAQGRGSYGAEKICCILRTEGESASLGVVSTIMREEGISSKHMKRRQRSLTDSRAARDEGYQNLVKDREVTGSFQVLSSDITYLPTAQGFDYHVQIMDVYTKQVLASVQQPHMRAELVREAIDRAIDTHPLPQGITFHSDRGSQYPSRLVKETLENLGWKASYSRVGKPGDNAWSESFFALLKKEVVHGANFTTREEARQGVFEYIYDFYNPSRKQKSLGHLSPNEFVRSLPKQALEKVA